MSVYLKKPAKEGQLLKLYGDVNEIGRTSITLYMEARSHNVYSGKQKYNLVYLHKIC